MRGCEVSSTGRPSQLASTMRTWRVWERERKGKGEGRGLAAPSPSSRPSLDTTTAAAATHVRIVVAEVAARRAVRSDRRARGAVDAPFGEGESARGSEREEEER